MYGAFSIEPSTRVIGQVSSGASIFDVDSTVGFGTTGELYVRYNDTTTGIVSYTSKSLTQFFGVSNVTGTISDAETVGVNTFAYGRSKLDQNEIIKVRVNSVLGSINLPSNTSDLLKGGIINISSLGVSENNKKSNKWFYNISPIYNINSINLIDASDKTYEVNLNVVSQFRIGDFASLILSDGTKKETKILAISGGKTFTIRSQGELDLNLTYKIQRNIAKGNSNIFANINQFSTDVSNVYNNENDYLVAS